MLKFCLNADSKTVFGHNNLKLDNIVAAKFEAKAGANTAPAKGDKGAPAKDAVADAPVEDICLNIQFASCEKAGFSTLA